MKAEHSISVDGAGVRFQKGSDGSVRAFEIDTGRELPATRAHWFAWISFYPGSGLID